jgi:hypothetical protein
LNFGSRPGAEKGVSGVRDFSLPARKIPKSQYKSRIIDIKISTVRRIMMMR